MSSGRYRVSINGFRCNTETWDDSLQLDGKRDEVFISTHVKYVNKEGKGLFVGEKISPVMGDTWDQPNRVQAGNASNRGGIISGDYFPTRTEIIWVPSTMGPITLPFTVKPIPPWVRSTPFPDPRDVPPFIAWEGDLTKNEQVVFITPSIWEWDPRQSIWQGWIQWLKEAEQQFGSKAKEIVTAKYPDKAWMFDAASLGIQLAATLFNVGGPVGNSGSRPIGYQKDLSKDPNGKAYSFNPWVLALSYDAAESLIAQQPSGLGNGVLAIRYLEDPYFRGDYTLYLQIEKVG